MIVTISKEIKDKWESFDVLAFSFSAKCEESNQDILDKIKSLEDYYKNISLEEVIKREHINDARCAYKAFGKDPSRYRLACESLLRRLSKGNSLYLINNLVDVGNILSIDLNRSTAILDYDKIEGDVYIRMGRIDDEYFGIGRGLINVSNIPLYCDKIGPFGSPTSDTERTMISDNTKRVLTFIICFSNKSKDESREMGKEYFKKYCNAHDFEDIEVVYEE